jgi:Fe-S oxidoreductase
VLTRVSDVAWVAAPAEAHGRGKMGRMRVALMVTCVNDAMFPGTGRAVVEVLSRLGVDVDFPQAQTCCGQPMVNTGYLDEAVPVVRTFVDAFAGYDAVVTPSGSCAGSARHQHRIVAERADDPALVRAVSEISPRVYELSEFLVDVLGVTDVGASFPHRVTYHPTCHSLRLLGVGDRPRRLLEAVRGLSLVDLPGAEECCGFGGTFAMKNADVSVAMGADKARHVRETDAEVLVAGDNSCLMHIGGLLSRERSGVRVMHLAEVLASTDPSVQPSSVESSSSVDPSAPVEPSPSVEPVETTP